MVPAAPKRHPRMVPRSRSPARSPNWAMLSSSWLIHWRSRASADMNTPLTHLLFQVFHFSELILLGNAKGGGSYASHSSLSLSDVNDSGVAPISRLMSTLPSSMANMTWGCVSRRTLISATGSSSRIMNFESAPTVRLPNRWPPPASIVAAPSSAVS